MCVRIQLRFMHVLMPLSRAAEGNKTKMLEQHVKELRTNVETQSKRALQAELIVKQLKTKVCMYIYMY
jgi:hypothetical protein